MDHQLDIHVDNGLHECIHFQLLVDDCLLEFYDLEHLHYHQLHQLDGIVDHTYHILHFYQEVHDGHQYLVLVHLLIHVAFQQTHEVILQHFHDVTHQCFHVEYLLTHEVILQHFHVECQLIHGVTRQCFHVECQLIHDVTRQCFHVACLQIHVEYQHFHVAFQYFHEVSQLIQLGQLEHLE